MTPRAMILAAGYGTRLGALTQSKPKPMLPVCGAPLVRWAVLWLRHYGVREITINLHHLGEQIVDELGDGRSLDVDITYSPEHGQILGTGGGLRQARASIDDGRDTPIVVVNGKILLELDLRRVLDEHVHRGAEATMVLRPDADAQRWGSLRIDDRGRIVRLLQAIPKGDPDATPSPEHGPLMFTGVHVLQPRFLDRIPPQGEQCVIRTAYRSLFDQAEGLYGHVTDRYWWEHSTPQRYLQGVFNVLDGRVALPYAEHPVVGVHPGAVVDAGAQIVEPVFVGPDVRIESGAVVGPHVQLGPRVRVEGSARLERCVVWEDVVVRGEHLDAVVARGGNGNG